MNAVFSFNEYKKRYFLIFGCWLLQQKNRVCPKNNGFAKLPTQRGLQPPAPALSAMGVSIVKTSSGDPFVPFDRMVNN